MKNRKIIYTIITLVFAVGFYIYDNYSGKLNTTNSTTDIVETDVNFLPTSTTNQIVHHKYYSLSYNEEYEQAEWVAYALNKNQLSNTNIKRPYFELDPKVSTKSAHYRNFKNSGYNKGHLCPAGDRKFSEEAFNETFFTSNISPQSYEFNGGIWNRLEQKVRYWAQKYDKLYIVTGGVLSKNLKTIGTEKVAVPNYFYKIILDYHEPEIKAIAFLMPHEDSEKGLYQFVTSIDEIEEITGIDFFPNLPDELENKLESSSNYISWNLN
ncbi:DNA/RNA non-specific endonuclease [Lutibacter sp.]|uniref:DNA/RNA non-specific endonuclease n=1 Tax=Lutibacter sp. TaxID=1925666 RepID=UPI001A200EA2|nr:DNA/RNA non-specific endonuclease [Lutibacter sp.]MBI9042360.1 DNA/RNA non-specific endonuclease [Lutibacter sp.]